MAPCPAGTLASPFRVDAYTPSDRLPADRSRSRNAAHESHCESSGSCLWACNRASARPADQNGWLAGTIHSVQSDSGIRCTAERDDSTLPAGSPGRDASNAIHRRSGDSRGFLTDRSVALEQFLLLAGFRVDQRDRVQAREPFDDQPPFVHPLARPAAAIVSQRSPGPVGAGRR